MSKTTSQQFEYYFSFDVLSDSIFLRIMTCIYIYMCIPVWRYIYIHTRTPKRNTWIPAKMILLFFRGLSYRVNYVYTYMTICKGYMYVYCITFRNIVEF